MSEGESIFNSNDFNILSVGRLVEQKGYERAIDVFYRLKQEGYKFKWYIIGDGILKKGIQKKINELELNKNICLLGIKDNPYPYIRQCNLFFLPSLYEGFPTVTIEAKVLEKPVLSTEVSGIKEQIINGETGIIVDNNQLSIYFELKSILKNTNSIKSFSSKNGLENIINNNEKYKKIISLLEKK